MRRLSLAALLTLAVLLPVHVATAYTITLSGTDTSILETRAYQGTGGATTFEALNPASLPYSYTSSSIDRGASSESEYDLSNDAFDITLDHYRLSTYGSYGWSTGDIYFSVDQDVNYTASGSYTAVDADGRLIDLRAWLYDITGISMLFDSTQQSRSTPDESFTLGLTEADYAPLNSFSGSLTGTLVAGHDYRFHYFAMLLANPSSSTTAATASGSVSLTFIPEPSTALLLALGIVGLAARRRRRVL
jgi:hypothetical protein